MENDFYGLQKQISRLVGEINQTKTEIWMKYLTELYKIKYPAEIEVNIPKKVINKNIDRNDRQLVPWKLKTKKSSDQRAIQIRRRDSHLAVNYLV